MMAAGKSVALAQMSYLQASLSACSVVRRVQLPARTFQLLARPSHSVSTRNVNGPQQRQWFHTTEKRFQREQVSSNKGDHKEQQQQHLKDHKSHESTSLYRSPIIINSDFQNVVSSGSRHAPVTDAAVSSEPTSTDTTKKRRVERQAEPFSKPKGQLTFREYMRRVTHPVAIVTASDTSVDSQGGPTSWRAATVSSFNSVTLDPTPYVSFNIKRISSTYDAIRHSGVFLVNLLGDNPEAVRLAQHFSRGNDRPDLFIDQRRTKARQSMQPEGQDLPNEKISLRSFVRKTKSWFLDNNDKHHHNTGPDGKVLDVSTLPPTLQFVAHRPASTNTAVRAVLFHSLCAFEPDKSTQVGDHVVVVGRVLHTLGDMDTKSSMAASCLTYSMGEYNHRGVNKSMLRIGERRK